MWSCKGLGQVSLEYLYMRAIKKHFGKVKFDLITYSTPPITFTKVIEWAKRNNPKAVTYLQLKDIFPQNAVDLGMMSKTGAKGVLYRRFTQGPDGGLEVEICPNSYEIPEQVRSDGGEEIPGQARDDVRAKYGLPADKPIIACTDVNCDTGTIAEENGYGFWVASNSVEAFGKAVDRMLGSDIQAMGERGYEFFLGNYTVENTYDAVMGHFGN